MDHSRRNCTCEAPCPSSTAPHAHASPHLVPVAEAACNDVVPEERDAAQQTEQCAAAHPCSKGGQLGRFALSYVQHACRRDREVFWVRWWHGLAQGVNKQVVRLEQGLVLKPAGISEYQQCSSAATHVSRSGCTAKQCIPVLLVAWLHNAAEICCVTQVTHTKRSKHQGKEALVACFKPLGPARRFQNERAKEQLAGAVCSWYRSGLTTNCMRLTRFEDTFCKRTRTCRWHRPLQTA